MKIFKLLNKNKWEQNKIETKCIYLRSHNGLFIGELSNLKLKRSTRTFIFFEIISGWCFNKQSKVSTWDKPYNILEI